MYLSRDLELILLIVSLVLWIGAIICWNIYVKQKRDLYVSTDKYKKNEYINYVGIALCILNLVLLGFIKTMKTSELTEKVQCEFLRVIDGDTISVTYNGEVVSVRLIGIDAPESVHEDETQNNEYGIKASNYTEALLINAEYVYLEFDTSMHDTYNRLLAYVYLSDQDDSIKESLNYLLIEAGYAVNKEYRPNIKYAEFLANACLDAQANNTGLWGNEEFRELWME